MILSMITLKAYLKEKQRASLTQLANAFGEQKSVIEGMLSHFIRKGQLRQCPVGSKACKGCPMSCATSNTPAFIFEWVC